MQNLKINPAYAGKTITKDLGYTIQRIEVDKVKPSQYERIYKMGFKEIFLTDTNVCVNSICNFEQPKLFVVLLNYYLGEVVGNKTESSNKYIFTELKLKTHIKISFNFKHLMFKV